MSRRQICPQCRLDRWIPLIYAPYCTRSCQRASGVLVACAICQHKWNPEDRGVSYRSGDLRWECADEIACLERRRVLIAKMQAGLDRVWQELAAAGWDLSHPALAGRVITDGC